jgi:hypothetical protein
VKASAVSWPTGNAHQPAAGVGCPDHPPYVGIDRYDRGEHGGTRRNQTPRGASTESGKTGSGMPPTELPLSAGCASPNTVVARSGLGAVSDQSHSQTNKLSNRRQQRPELSRVAEALSPY